MSLTIKVSLNGIYSEYIFTNPGSIFIGTDRDSVDIHLDMDLGAQRLLEIKLKPEKVLVRSIFKDDDVLMDSKILPKERDIVYKNGQCLSFRNKNIQIFMQFNQDEQSASDSLLIKNIEYHGLQDKIQKLHLDSDKIRGDLQVLESNKLRKMQDLDELNIKFELQRQEITQEKTKVQKYLLDSSVAEKDALKLRDQIQKSQKEKLLLEGETQILQEKLKALEKTKSDTHLQLIELKKILSKEEAEFHKVRGDKNQIFEEGEGLKLSNYDLRSQMQKLEEKISLKKNQLNQLEFKAHEETRKMDSLTFQIERSAQHLRDLQHEEKGLEVKMMLYREEALTLDQKAQQHKKHLMRDLEETKERLQSEIQILHQQIEVDSRNLASLKSEENDLIHQVEALTLKQKNLYKDQAGLEARMVELDFHKTELDDQIQTLKREKSSLIQDKEKSRRDLEGLQDKISESEIHALEILEASKVEMENFKRDERMKIALERDVARIEMENLKQRSIIDTERDIRQMQEAMYKEKENIFKEADMVRVEANIRLRESTQILTKAQLEGRDLIKNGQTDLLADLAQSKIKVKNFLNIKRKNALTNIQHMTELHQQKLKRDEEWHMKNLEHLKRKEFKKIARLRDDELTKLNVELTSAKEKHRRNMLEFKQQQELEISTKKKDMLEHLNLSKARQESKWKEDLQREKDEFEQSKKARVLSATEAVMSILASDDHMLKDKISSTLSVAINGQNAKAAMEMDQVLDFNPQNRKRILPVLQKYSLSVGLPAIALITILLDVGNIRSGTINLAKTMLEQQHSASEIYVNQQKTEWKEKHTFNPDQTTGYKSSFTDNVLYTKDFGKVMDDEAFQNEWILKVHDFIVKELELSEDTAITYISAESGLIKDLEAIKKDIHPQHLDAGLKKMSDAEAAQMNWLKEKFNPEKLVKFSDFRKTYFDKFYDSKYGGSRGLATEAPAR